MIFRLTEVTEFINESSGTSYFTIKYVFRSSNIYSSADFNIEFVVPNLTKDIPITGSMENLDSYYQ